MITIANRLHLYFLTILFLLLSYGAFAQQSVDSLCRSVEIGEVVVVGMNHNPATSLPISTIDMSEKKTISEALSLIPGVHVTAGAKSDMVYVRGFDQRQVPVFYDGIPIYIPYDGYIDLGMLMAANISQLSVDNATGSLLYGPNTLGGAINIVTARPSLGLSGMVKVGSFTSGKLSLLSGVAYAEKKFYVKADFAISDANDYRLSGRYMAVSPLEDGGGRENSYKRNGQYSVKVGYTPLDGHEYAVSYIKHDGSKGVPSYLGNNGAARFWTLPKYTKSSVYLLTNSKLGKGFALKTRVYYDKFDNIIVSYDDKSHTTQLKKQSFTSIYDDYSLGAIVRLSYTHASNVALLDIQFKHDNHREHYLGDPIINMMDNSLTLSLVDRYYWSNWTLYGGVALSSQYAIKAEYLNANSQVAQYKTKPHAVVNGELSVDYLLSKAHRLKAGVSYKTHFPTMKDRYSVSLGKSIVNPELKAENGWNATLDYSGSFLDNRITIYLSAYYSRLENAVLAVYGVDATNPQIFQMQNQGSAQYYGAEALLSCKIIKSLTATVNYSYVKRENLTSADVKFVGVPEHSIRGELVYRFLKSSYINLNVEHYSQRYSTSNGVKTDGFTLLNFKCSYYLYRQMLCLEGGVNNIFDTSYELSEGYPMAGRNCYLSLLFSF